MGPPTAPNYSAIGDCVNAVVRLAGANFNEFPSSQISLHGKQRSVTVYSASNPVEVSTDGW